jgi:hypothetical protein
LESVEKINAFLFRTIPETNRWMKRGGKKEFLRV